MNNFLKKTVLFSLCFTSLANAGEVPINQVLEQVLQNSNSKKSAQYSLKASEGEANKAEKHWLPTLYIDGTTYQTNDPAKNFMGNLYQRSVTSSDFNTSSINKTASKSFSRSAVGINLPIYQGGSGVAYSDYAKSITTSKKYDLKQAEVDQYCYTSAIYISLVSLAQQKERLQKIASSIEGVIKKYSLGNSNNQIGYSGSLILQASQNKTKSFLIDNEEKTKALYQILKETGFENENAWSVAKLPVDHYIGKYLRFKSENSSFKTSSLKAKVDAAKNEEKISNAKNLPQLNLYAENYSFNGSRATQNGYTAGVNLHWSFYDPLSYGNDSISQNNTNSSRHEFLAHQQNEKAEIEYLNSQINSLEEAVKLATKNDALMFKNVNVSKDLFKSGAITASNLSDAIMKYLDNFVYLSNAELQLIELHSKKLAKQQVDISEILSSKNE